MPFTYAAVYMVEAVCLTPLRTGGTDGDPEQVLRDRDGTAFLQGCSLAGALRSWMESGPDCSLTESLFGNQRVSGHLNISDAVFDETAEQYTRPRLRMDPSTATGDPGGKFDMAHIGAGAALRFTLTWSGALDEAEQELPAVERMLAAMDAGEILLGAQKSNGFGRLTLSAKKSVFDLTDSADRKRWLSDQLEGTPLNLAQPEQRRSVLFTVRGQAGNLLIKAAPVYEKDEEGTTSSYTPNLQEGGQAILPGSSVKGSVRNRAAYIAKLLALKDDTVDNWFGRNARGEDKGVPGKIQFQDVRMSKAERKISRIRIDRFTGGVFRGGLFTEEPVCSDITLQITAPQEAVPCALLLYALRDLGLGLYNLGSGWAIGRGQIAVRTILAETPDGGQAALNFDGHGGITKDDPTGLFRDWLERLEEARHEN